MPALNRPTRGTKNALPEVEEGVAGANGRI